MAISRMQEPRQLYGLGSLVRKITRPIKKIVKSPIGKAALLGLGAYGLGGGFGANELANPTLEDSISLISYDWLDFVKLSLIPTRFDSITSPFLFSILSRRSCRPSAGL